MKQLIIKISLCFLLLAASSVSFSQSKTDAYLKNHFAKKINDPKLPDLHKRIFLDQEWRLSEENSFSILWVALDSLSLSSDKDTRFFYMIIAGKSAKHADGAYSEGLGAISKEYVDNHLKEFVNCFIGKHPLDARMLETWSGLVMGEIQLASSTGDTTQFDKTISGYKKNSSNFNKKEKEVLDKFIAIMKKEWEIVNPNK